MASARDRDDCRDRRDHERYEHRDRDRRDHDGRGLLESRWLLASLLSKDRSLTFAAR
ncbi:MAG: hypothetical protein ABSH47_21260 [Bryobacteraceae bacterium]|jgi:hypothetical protein